jgi:hypothetical protein
MAELLTARPRQMGLGRPAACDCPRRGRAAARRRAAAVCLDVFAVVFGGLCAGAPGGGRAEGTAVQEPQTGRLPTTWPFGSLRSAMEPASG